MPKSVHARDFSSSGTTSSNYFSIKSMVDDPSINA